MENFKKKLHPVTVWCTYSLYFSSNFREHTKRFTKMINSNGLDTRGLSFEDINGYSKQAVELKLDPKSIVQKEIQKVEKALPVKISKIKKEIKSLEEKSIKQINAGNQSLCKETIDQIERLKEQIIFLNKTKNDNKSIKSRIEFIDKLAKDSKLTGANYMSAINLKSNFNELEFLKGKAKDFYSRGLHSAYEQEIKEVRKKEQEILIWLNKLETKIF